MRRHHYLDGRSRYLTAPGALEEIAERLRELATDQAQQCGLMDADGPGSWTHPDLSRMLYADGKVVTPLFRAKPGDKRIDKTTGEVHYRGSRPMPASTWRGRGKWCGERSS